MELRSAEAVSSRLLGLSQRSVSEDLGCRRGEFSRKHYGSVELEREQHGLLEEVTGLQETVRTAQRTRGAPQQCAPTPMHHQQLSVRSHWVSTHFPLEQNSALLAEAKGRKENLQAPEAQKDAILQELQMEIRSLHRLLRQTLEALATQAPEPEAQPLSTEPWREPSQCADQNCRRAWWLLPHLLLVLLLALLCLLPHITPRLELSYLRSPPL